MMFYKRIFILISDQQRILKLTINFPWFMVKKTHRNTVSLEATIFLIWYHEKHDWSFDF